MKNLSSEEINKINGGTFLEEVYDCIETVSNWFHYAIK